MDLGSHIIGVKNQSPSRNFHNQRSIHEKRFHPSKTNVAGFTFCILNKNFGQDIHSKIVQKYIVLVNRTNLVMCILEEF